MRSKEMPEGASEKSRRRWRKKGENALLCSSGFCSLTFPGSFAVGTGTWSPVESKRVWSPTSDQAFSGFQRRLAQGHVRRGRETKQLWDGSLKCTRSSTKCWLHNPWTRLSLARFYQVTEHEASIAVSHTDRYYRVKKGGWECACK